jgi:prevent-host-death family protein
MTRRYSIAEARANLAGIVDEAERGSQIEITRRGEPVAVVISPRELDRLRGGRATFAQAYQAFLEKHSLGDLGVDDDFAAALRSRAPGRKVSL